MAEENAKAWTPVCVASSGRQSGRPIDLSRSRLASSSLSTVQIEPGATSGDEPIDQDTDLGYFKSAEW